LRKLSDELKVPMVDSLTILAEARATVERNLENSLGLADRPQLPRSAPDHTTLVFRVSRGSIPVSKALSIVGIDPQLGELSPNTVLMHDDGTGGDQRAGDGVWSFTATFPSGADIAYVYTNSGTRGRWEGLDVPHIRRVHVPRSTDGSAVYLPIETFGRVYLQADNWHADAVGYDLIGQAVARAIVASRPGRPGP
jgi:hypothetical protein